MLVGKFLSFLSMRSRKSSRVACTHFTGLAHGTMMSPYLTENYEFPLFLQPDARVRRIAWKAARSGAGAVTTVVTMMMLVLFAQVNTPS